MMDKNHDQGSRDTLLDKSTTTDIESATHKGSVKRCNKPNLLQILLVAASILLVIVIATCTGSISFKFGQKSNESNKESPEVSNVHYVIKPDEQSRSEMKQEKFIKDWVVGNEVRHDEILSGPDKYGVFTVSETGDYEIAVQVVFHNMNALNTVTVVIDGEDCISSSHSAPLQLSKAGNWAYAVTTPVTVSSKRCLSRGARLTISLGYEGASISALQKHTFLDIEKRKSRVKCS